MFSIDIIHSQKGILTDLDEEWMELECMEKKKKVQKILRIDQISAVKKSAEKFRENFDEKLMRNR